MSTTFPTRFRRSSLGPGWIFYFLLLLLGVSSISHAQPQLSARVDRQEIAIGETVNLTLSLEGIESPNLPQLPAMDGFENAGQSQGSQIAIFNGTMRRTMNYTYALRPTREGTLTIPALQFNLGGTKLTTQSFQITVSKDPLAEAVKRMAFAQMFVKKRALYVGEVFPVEFHLFFYLNSLTENPSMPTFTADGFTMLGAPKHTNDVVITNNARFQRVIFRLALVAAKAGELEVGPFKATLSINVPRPNRNDNDPFAGILGRNFVARTAVVEGETVKVQVLPLPSTGVPPEFNGSIGTFQITRTAGPTEVQVGDPITQKIHITGAGTFDGVTLPEPSWPNFKSYPPTSKFEASDAIGISGTKEFDLVVAPMSPDVRQLPPLVFAYFDPEAGQYRTLATPPVGLKVTAVETPAPPPNLAPKSAGSALMSETAHIKPRMGTLRKPPQAWITQGWFVGLQTLPVLAFVAAFFWRQRLDYEQRNPHLRRSKEIALAIQRGLDEMSAHAAANRSDPFHAALFRVLQESVGERLGRPAASITEAAVDELPESSNPNFRAELHTLFRLCNEARYAPVSTTEQLTAVKTRAETMINRLRAAKGAK